LALKNKYKKEKKELEEKVAELEKYLAEISGDNRSLTVVIERISEEYDKYLKDNEKESNDKYLRERE
jgi:hypothetical protein